MTSNLANLLKANRLISRPSPNTQMRSYSLDLKRHCAQLALLKHVLHEMVLPTTVKRYEKEVCPTRATPRASLFLKISKMKKEMLVACLVCLQVTKKAKKQQSI